MTNPLPPTENWERICDSAYFGFTVDGTKLKDFIRTLLADQTKRVRVEVLSKVEELENPYPESVFKPLTDKQLKLTHELLMEKMGFPIDKLSGHMCRIGWNAYKEALKSSLEESLEGEGKMEKL